MDIRWLGNASLEVRCKHTHVLIDPFYQKGKAEQNRILTEALNRADLILITHPHFDHFNDIKMIAGRYSVPVCVGPSGPVIARRLGVRKAEFSVLKDGMTIELDKDAKIQVYSSSHISFDDRLIKETAARALRLKNIAAAAAVGLRSRIFSISEDDVFGFEVTEGNKSIFLIGSGALRDDIEYPVHPDVFILAYQGRSDLDVWSERLIRRISPAETMLFHYDDAFPPISKRVRTERIRRRCLNVAEAEFGVWKEI
ncbi:MAG: MBL fold metallo-hydrolase [Erysipelotrichaceae bacterium]|nr:MBL fold metallo-hydrolase [Erysipelotrichaceae bacterium]